MIVVTGAAGFIGSIVVAALEARGEQEILAVDTLGTEGKFKNLRARALVDIISPHELLPALRSHQVEPRAIIHMGAITDTSDKDADRMLAMNTKYTRDLAAWAIENDVRFVYASSASVYGDGSLGFADDDSLTPRLLPMNPYAWSKWLFDAEAIRKDWVNSIVGLRFYNVFGPNEYHKARMASVIWHSYNQIRDTGGISLFQSHKEGIADGEQRRDFVYVKDVVDVVLWAALDSRATGIFNLGTGQARSYNNLANAIFRALGMEPQITYIPTPENIRGSYQYFTQADLSRLRAAGCTHTFASLEDTVADYVQGYLTQSNPYV
ncbi:MAG: ADP-glyceromanno-heptose 6-epimerase [Capsulimonadaceae bacterium]